jgi:hypothetical protein
MTILLSCATIFFSCDSGTTDCAEGETQNTGEICGLNGEGEMFVTCVEGSFSSENGCTGTDVCVNGEIQEGTTVCGFNDEGLLSQTCVKGQWEDGEECSGDDVCLNGETQDGGSSCGLNEEGLLIEECVEGAWVEGSECTGTHECVNEESQEGSTVCGLNDEGVLMQFCIEGAWVDGEECTGTDECTNGETQEGTTACGLNEEGVFMQDCTEGAWVENETCTGTAVCVNGEIQDTETICGLNSEGIVTQDCTDGAWVEGACTGTDVCVEGADEEGPTACGLNAEGFLMQLCIEGAWAEYQTCTGTDVCENGSTQESTTACGLNNEGALLDDCTEGAWIAGTACSGTDVCTNEETQEGSTVCGFNNDGFVIQQCVAGVWADKESESGCADDLSFSDSFGDTCASWYHGHPDECAIADVWVNDDGVDAEDACCICGGGIIETTGECTAEADCLNGDTQKGDTPCGLNGEGGLMQDCVQGVWSDNETCEDANDVCVNGAKEDTEIACGTNLEGFGQDLCVSGQWLPYYSGGNACLDDDTFFDSWLQSCWNYNWGGCETALDKVNDEGVDATMACCPCGGGTSVCTGTDECTNGETKEDVEGDTCGLNNEGHYQLECIDGLWEDTTNCSGTDVCVNGTSQPSVEESCEAGGPQQEDCVWGQWSPQTQFFPSECVDDDTFVDAANADCNMYTLAPEFCNTAEDMANAEGLDATEACCVCGGGTTIPSYNGPACFEPFLLKGVMDFGLPSTDGKGLHFVVHADIADLSVYGVGVANNGGGTDGQEYAFPAISVTAGQQVLLARNVTALETYFDTCYAIFDITLEANSFINQNGDDAIELFKDGAVIQTYGNPTGWMLNYSDSWAYRFWGTNWNKGSQDCTDGAATVFETSCLYPACEPYVPEEE